MRPVNSLIRRPTPFQVEDALFRLHTFVLLRYCAAFRESFSPGLTDGSTDERAIDISEMGSDEFPLTADAFGLALRVLYPEYVARYLYSITAHELIASIFSRELFDHPPNTTDEWVNVLKTGVSLQSTFLRHAAISRLADLSTLQKLKIALAGDIHEWLHPILEDLCAQRPHIPNSTLDLFSTPTTRRLLSAREDFRAEFLSKYQDSRCSLRVGRDGAYDPKITIAALVQAMNSRGEDPSTVIGAFESVLHFSDRCCGAERAARLVAFKPFIRELVGKVLGEHDSIAPPVSSGAVEWSLVVPTELSPQPVLKTVASEEYPARSEAAAGLMMVQTVDEPFEESINIVETASLAILPTISPPEPVETSGPEDWVPPSRVTLAPYWSPQMTERQEAVESPVESRRAVYHNPQTIVARSFYN